MKVVKSSEIPAVVQEAAIKISQQLSQAIHCHINSDVATPYAAMMQHDTALCWYAAQHFVDALRDLPSSNDIASMFCLKQQGFTTRKEAQDYILEKIVYMECVSCDEDEQWYIDTTQGKYLCDSVENWFKE